MFDVNVLCYPWDLEDEGVENVLDCVQGELGVDGITVLVAGRPLTQLRRRRQVAPRVFRTRGGLFFQPDQSKYRSTRLKPVVSGWLKARNPLATIAHACRKRDIQLRAVLHTRRIGRLAARFTSCATKSPFGDHSPGLICQHNPDVAEFLRALVNDLSENYPLAAIVLRDLGRPFDTDLLDVLEPAPALGSAGRELLAVCFCESCIQAAGAAGIDTDAVVEFVQRTMSQAIEAGHPLADTLNEQLSKSQPLEDYIRNRSAAHGAFVETLPGRATCELALHMTTDGIFAASENSGLSPRWDMLVVEAGPPASPEGGGILRFIDGWNHAAAQFRVEAQIPGYDPAAPDGTTLVKALDHLARSRFSGVILDHYGIMAHPEFTAAKQAIRYATRTTRT
ncbi:MAG: hypothetical protein V3W34_00095 [Phycisphaerae bacterium]